MIKSIKLICSHCDGPITGRAFHAEADSRVYPCCSALCRVYFEAILKSLGKQIPR